MESNIEFEFNININLFNILFFAGYKLPAKCMNSFVFLLLRSLVN